MRKIDEIKNDISKAAEAVKEPEKERNLAKGYGPAPAVRALIWSIFGAAALIIIKSITHKQPCYYESSASIVTFD